MNTIEFIYFDLGNVILQFSHDRMISQVATACQLSHEAVKTHMFDSGLEDRYETGEIDTQQFYDEFSQTSGSRSNFEDFMQACGDIFWLNDSIVPVISQLSQIRNLGLGILSNTCPAHWDFVQKKFPVLRTFFPVTVTSYQAQSMKPDAKIYQRAIEKAGIANDRIFFTDDKTENVAAAIDAGMIAKPFINSQTLIRDLSERGVRIG